MIPTVLIIPTVPIVLIIGTILIIPTVPTV